MKSNFLRSLPIVLASSVIGSGCATNQTVVEVSRPHVAMNQINTPDMFVLSDLSKLEEYVDSFISFHRLAQADEKILRMQFNLFKVNVALYKNLFKHRNVTEDSIQKFIGLKKKSFFDFFIALGIEDDIEILNKLLQDILFASVDSGYVKMKREEKLESAVNDNIDDILYVASQVERNVEHVFESFFGASYYEYDLFDIYPFDISNEEVESGKLYFSIVENKFKNYEKYQSDANNINLEKFAFFQTRDGQLMVEQFNNIKPYVDYSNEVVSLDRNGDHNAFYVFLIRHFGTDYSLAIQYFGLMKGIVEVFDNLNELGMKNVMDDDLSQLLDSLKKEDSLNEFRNILSKMLIESRRILRLASN